MWMMVMFDLPTGTPPERKMYGDFRNVLLENGFRMSQYSVYFRFCGERECCAKYVRAIKMQLRRRVIYQYYFYGQTIWANYKYNKEKICASSRCP